MSDTKVKKRYWAFVGYPESLPTNWMEILELTGLPVAISPYHDKDIEQDGVTPKKPHYHVILAYGGPTTFASVKRFTDSLKQPIPIPLESVKGYYRYFTHMDNADKYQYEAKEIKTLNGFSYQDYFDLTKTDVIRIKKELFSLIEVMDIVEYRDFIQEVMKSDETGEKIDIASSNTILFNAYIKSRRHKIESIRKS